MAEVLEGLIINPKRKKKKKTRARKNPAKVMSIMKPKRGGGMKKVGEIIIKNPAKDTKTLMMLASGTALGLAGGKLLETMLKPRVPQISALIDKGIPVGDIVVMGIGFMGLKKGKKNKEFFLGLVAGSASRAILNLIDTYVFKGKGLVSLRGDEEEIEPLPEPTEDVIPAEVVEEEEPEPDVLSVPEDIPVDELSKLSEVDSI